MQKNHRLHQAWRFLCLSLIALSGMFYMGFVEPNWIDVHPLSLTLARLDPAFEGYKIVQITDLHADKWMTADRLSKIVQIVNQQTPDLVAITGDYVTKGDETYVPNLTVLDQLNPNDLTVGVLGNHDYYGNPPELHRTLLESNVLLMRNRIGEIRRGDATLLIAGLGDAMMNDANLPYVMDRMPPTGAAILLAHEPDFADETAATHRFDLQLSGHSHGGQIKLPFVGVRRITPKMAKKYPNGLYKIDDLWQYTSRGIGLARHVKVRLNCRPEVTVFTLHASAA
ncbi:metallophosphoesterase [filamentous cyanobacterium LEGE 11480]|uniref:Metallophosphoesterase n=1 Tax=Romeriopsis navalis LEGE 11480 TaxID=2777977 RepID=A0A928VSX9_9CYAN|nr:metallophosphoesterase [Romeriopsis navalis]MBE9031960.1 metallophosphoesterase [Romeriopsis navalis LEGE 11480]